MDGNILTARTGKRGAGASESHPHTQWFKAAVDWRGQVVIHWGAAHDEWPLKPALQPIRAILRAQMRSKREELLHLHGIKTVAWHNGRSAKDERLAFTHKYKVAVFHLQTLVVYEKKETLLLSEKALYDQRQLNASSAYIEVMPDRTNFMSVGLAVSL